MFISVEFRQTANNELITLLLLNGLILSSVLFGRNFLTTKQYNKLDTVLKFIILLSAISLISGFLGIFLFNFTLNVLFAAMLILIFTGLYALWHKNIQAYYYVAGWGMVLGGILGTLINNYDIYPITEHFPYLLEFSLFVEAVLFSLALSNKIKRLQLQKIEADKKSLQLQRQYTLQLESEVMCRKLIKPY
jgi:asparagine N-glycosylation enzyme membrane subunit Stt3